MIRGPEYEPEINSTRICHGTRPLKNGLTVSESSREGKDQRSRGKSKTRKTKPGGKEDSLPGTEKQRQDCHRDDGSRKRGTYFHEGE